MDESGEKEKCEKGKKREEAVSAWKPFFMDESIEREMLELGEINHSGHVRPGCREVGRIIVSGYDTRLRDDVLKKVFISRFSQCGRITDIYVDKIPHASGTEILNKYSLIYIVGEGAVENALQLNGTDIEGSTLNIIAYPFPSTLVLTVKGFDASLDEMVIQRRIINFLSSCGEVLRIFVYGDGSAHVTLEGEDAAEKVQKLNGSCFMGHHKLVVQDVYYMKKRIFHRRGVKLRLWSQPEIMEST